MKYVIALCALFLGGCAARVEYVVVTTTPAPVEGPTSLECDAAWVELSPDFSAVGAVVSDLLNKTQVPDSIGETLQTCISQGWRGFDFQVYGVSPDGAVGNSVSALTFDEATLKVQVVATVPEGTGCFALGRGEIVEELGGIMQQVDTLRVRCPSILSGKEVHLRLNDLGTLGLFLPDE